jgi:hypothetical protein
MNTQFALTAAALALFTLGCNSNGPDTAVVHEQRIDPQEQDDHDRSNDDHGHTDAKKETPEVVLDHGKRWIANKETTEGIANMSALIAEYDDSNGDPKALKARVEEEFALIFERCTMTGESHDQLHNYLMPIHQEMNEIDFSEAAERDALIAYLATYSNYFE